MVYIISPTEGACLQKIKISRKSCVNVNTVTFCHPSDPSMMLAACAGMGSFELSAWSITKTKSVKLINFSGLPSSKGNLGTLYNLYFQPRFEFSLQQVAKSSSTFSVLMKRA